MSTPQVVAAQTAAVDKVVELCSAGWFRLVVQNLQNNRSHFGAAMEGEAEAAYVGAMCLALDAGTVDASTVNAALSKGELGACREAILDAAWKRLRPNG